jgi:hypothetical protein
VAADPASGAHISVRISSRFPNRRSTCGRQTSTSGIQRPKPSHPMLSDVVSPCSRAWRNTLAATVLKAGSANIFATCKCEMAKLPKYTLGYNDPKQVWSLQHDQTKRVVKNFDTKQEATTGGVLEKTLGKARASKGSRRTGELNAPRISGFSLNSHVIRTSKPLCPLGVPLTVSSEVRGAAGLRPRHLSNRARQERRWPVI